MPLHVELEFASKTDTGRVRTHNEDAISISEQCSFAILADGMGGYNAGEVASQIATSVLKETLEGRLLHKAWDGRFHRSRRLHQIVQESIAHANASIMEAARLEPSYSGMGTTLVAALFYYDKVTIAHIGDSRAYRLRKNEMVQLTRDHSLLQEQIDAGLVSVEDAQFSEHRNLITRAMGIDESMQVELNDFVTEECDIYLLCSDGLSDMVSAQEIAHVVSIYHSDLALACDELIHLANDKGGHDNISVILAKITSQPMDSSSKIGSYLFRLFASRSAE